MKTNLKENKQWKIKIYKKSLQYQNSAHTEDIMHSGIHDMAKTYHTADLSPPKNDI